MTRRTRTSVLRGLCAGLVLLGWQTQLRADDAEFFEQKIRPILVEHCFECHSGMEKESGLRVDSLASLLTGGERGPALVPGKPDDSVLIQAVRHDDTLQMPPERKLPQPVINDLMQWVKEGAVWPNSEAVAIAPHPMATERLPTDEDRRFWAFQSPTHEAIPHVADSAAWARTPIDRFILQKLEAQQLTPQPLADKRTLIRRASLALIGIPPAPETVQAFLLDDSPLAFATVVERLLASPQYGERWGRHWLDVARYGDSNGLDENLALGNAWRYRDYVIEAFNADMPYDEFLREQLAGDLLPLSSDEEIQMRRVVATGFLSLGAKMLAEDDPVKMEMDIIDEQLDTLGKAVLGITLGCARCHDHKFDPISIHDYYALAGILKSTKTMDNFGVVARWQERPLASPSTVAEWDRLEAAAEAVQTDIEHRVKAESDRITAQARSQLAEYLLAADRLLRIEDSLANASPIEEDDSRHDKPECILIEAEDFVRGNVMKDNTNYGAGIGVLVNRGELPNFTEYEIEIQQAGWYQFDLKYAAAESRPTILMVDERPIKANAAGNVTGSWTPDGQDWFVEVVAEMTDGKHIIRLECAGPFPHIDKLCLAPVKGEPPASVGGNSPVQLQPLFVASMVKFLTAQRDITDGPFSLWWKMRKHGSIEEITAESSSIVGQLLADPQPATLSDLSRRYQELASDPEVAKSQPLTTLLTATDGPFTLGDTAETAFSEGVSAELKSLREQKTEIEKASPDLPEAMSITDGSPQNLRIHLRGSHTTLGEEVGRRIPHILAMGDEPPITDTGSGRLQLAEWITRADHPLTARVLVNRVWQAHFGDGLVRSPDNFGRLGELPTHPELLDWLSTEFVRSGWSIKSLHRMILHSAVWQQTTDGSATAAEIDPENRLLWRMNRRRLEAEAIRDSLLSIGGDLDSTMRGSLLPTENRKYVTSTANINVEVYNSPRRTVYLPIVRSALYDYLTAFDFGDPSAMSGQRDRTTVAPQALYLMNSELVAKESAALANTLLDQPGEDAGRVTEAFERFYSRPPSESEIVSSLKFLVAYERSLTATGTAADQTRRLAWKAFLQALMSTNEFLYVN